MKFIRKGRKPAALAKFERENAATPQVATYGGLTSEAKSATVAQMLREQGGLCGYTMKRIGAAIGPPDYHVEHIRPRSRYPTLQIDYANLLLCAPEGPCDWGARCKDEADVDSACFVSPLHESCETRFAYRQDGSVRIVDASDRAAQSTIELLNLNHRDLIAQRSEALRRAGFGPYAEKPLSAQQSVRIGALICKRNREGNFEPFCIAIRQVAERTVRKAHDRSARLRDAH